MPRGVPRRTIDQVTRELLDYTGQVRYWQALATRERITPAERVSAGRMATEAGRVVVRLAAELDALLDPGDRPYSFRTRK